MILGLGVLGFDVLLKVVRFLFVFKVIRCSQVTEEAFVVVWMAFLDMSI